MSVDELLLIVSKAIINLDGVATSNDPEQGDSEIPRIGRINGGIFGITEQFCEVSVVANERTFAKIEPAVPEVLCPFYNPEPIVVYEVWPFSIGTPAPVGAPVVHDAED